MYKACLSYSGFGITSELILDIDDIVGVLKKADPCGNATNWFVDNGSTLKSYQLFFYIIIKYFLLFIVVKGIISSDILKPFIEQQQQEQQHHAKKLTEQSSLGSFESEEKSVNISNNECSDDSNIHNYVNNNSNDEDCQSTEVIYSILYFQRVLKKNGTTKISHLYKHKLFD